MSARDVSELLVLLLGFVTFLEVFYLYSKLTMEQVWVKPNSIYSIASMSLDCIGEYSNCTTTSIRYWIYSVEAAMWKKDSSLNLLDTFKQWNSESNNDQEGFILNGIEEAHTMFLSDLESARKEDRQPVFKVSSEYDFHVCPKSLIYNDYVDTGSLLQKIDVMMGGD